MAKVIIGGQALSLVLALLVTPVFYTLLDMVVNLTRRLGIRFSVEPTPQRRPEGPRPHGKPETIETYARQ
jgi:HAE1 family hydrophobic/amphiphilic exporter-1